MKPAVYSNLHLLADRPSLEVDTSEPYPSLTIRPQSGDVMHCMTVSLTGNHEDRIAFARLLREAATRFDSWQPEPIDPNGPDGYDPTLAGEAVRA